VKVVLRPLCFTSDVFFSRHKISELFGRRETLLPHERKWIQFYKLIPRSQNLGEKLLQQNVEARNIFLRDIEQLLTVIANISGTFQFISFAVYSLWRRLRLSKRSHDVGSDDALLASCWHASFCAWWPYIGLRAFVLHDITLRTIYTRRRLYYMGRDSTLDTQCIHPSY